MVPAKNALCIQVNSSYKAIVCNKKHILEVLIGKIHLKCVLIIKYLSTFLSLYRIIIL